MKELIVYEVEVKKKDFRFFDLCVEELRKQKSKAKSSLSIVFDGYGEEERELFEVPEIKLYAEEMLKRCPEIFYYLNRIKNFDRLFLSLLSTVKIDRKANGIVRGSITVPIVVKNKIISGTEEYTKLINDEAYMYWIYTLFKKGGTG